MLVVVTGISGVGKTTIMKNSHVRVKQINLDNWVKKNLYFKWQKGYKVIKKHFGEKYVNFWNVSRYELGKLVFNDKEKLSELNDLVFPLVKKFLMKIQNSQKNYIIEQATYLAFENEFKHYYQKVILIKRLKNKNLSNYKAITENEIKKDFVILNNQKLDSAIKSYEEIIKKIF